VLDAVCLREIASVERWGRGFNVYVKKLDFGGSNRPIWHDGLNLEDDPPPHEPHRSVHLYHLNIRPHETADLIIEVPGKDDQLPEGTDLVRYGHVAAAASARGTANCAPPCGTRAIVAAGTIIIGGPR
jgi:hypothetical protein